MTPRLQEGFPRGAVGGRSVGRWEVVSRSRVVSREPPTAAPDDATGCLSQASINKAAARVNQNKARTCGACSSAIQLQLQLQLQSNPGSSGPTSVPGCGRRCDVFVCVQNGIGLGWIWWICHPPSGTINSLRIFQAGARPEPVDNAAIMFPIPLLIWPVVNILFPS